MLNNEIIVFTKEMADELIRSYTMVASSGVSIMSKLEPLVSLIKDIAEPCSYGMMLFGFIKVALSDVMAGKRMIKNAIYGFIGVQITPWMFDIIKSTFK